MFNSIVLSAGSYLPGWFEPLPQLRCMQIPFRPDMVKAECYENHKKYKPKFKIYLIRIFTFWRVKAVSYTHLDVYKRQV